MRSRRRRSYTLTIIWFMLVLAFVVMLTMGWIMNIFKLASCDFSAPYNCEIVHGIGLIPIVGMFTGWMTFEDYKDE